MDGLRVKDMLGLELLKDLIVASGTEGLEKNVENITFLDAPDAARWIRGNEFVITTLYLFRESEEQVKLIKVLADKNASALGIKLTRFVGSISNEVKAAAEYYGLPLIIIPENKAWVDLISPVMAEVNSRQLVMLEKTASVRRMFTREVLEGGRLLSIARILSETVKSSVSLVEYVNGGINSWPENLEEELDQEILTALRSPGNTDIFEIMKDKLPRRGVIMPINVAKKTEGLIVIWDKEELDEFGIAAAEQALTVSALYIQQLKAVNEVNQRFRDQFITQLINGDISSAYIKDKADEVFWSMNDFNYIALIRRSLSSPEIKSEIACDPFKELQNHLGHRGRNDLLMGLYGSDTMIIIIPWREDDQLPRLLVEEIGAFIKSCEKNNEGLEIGLGLSSLCQSIEQFPRAFMEARTAAKVSLARRKPCYYDLLGPDRLFIELLKFNETAQFINETIEPIRQYDQENNAELFRTLEAFIQAGGNYRKTARKLFTHHNTIRYRLETIEGLLNVSLKNPEVILDLMLGIRLFYLKR